jgi:hypothetical protein
MRATYDGPRSWKKRFHDPLFLVKNLLVVVRSVVGVNQQQEENGKQI